MEVKGSPVKESFARLKKVLFKINKDKKVLYFLGAFFFYIDGVYTIIDLATSYGKDVGIDDTHLLLALLLTQIVAFPCSLLFGKFSARFKSEKLIKVCILGYLGIALFALQLDRAWEFWFLAVCVAVFQGAIQALSRSYFARIIPKENSSEYFGFYDIFGNGSGVHGNHAHGHFHTVERKFKDRSGNAGGDVYHRIFPVRKDRENQPQRCMTKNGSCTVTGADRFGTAFCYNPPGTGIYV